MLAMNLGMTLWLSHDIVTSLIQTDNPGCCITICSNFLHLTSNRCTRDCRRNITKSVYRYMTIASYLAEADHSWNSMTWIRWWGSTQCQCSIIGRRSPAAISAILLVISSACSGYFFAITNESSLCWLPLSLLLLPYSSGWWIDKRLYIDVVSSSGKWQAQLALNLLLVSYLKIDPYRVPQWPRFTLHTDCEYYTYM